MNIRIHDIDIRRGLERGHDSSPATHKRVHTRGGNVDELAVEFSSLLVHAAPANNVRTMPMQPKASSQCKSRKLY